MDAEIKNLPALTVLGLSLQTLPKSPDIPKLWDKFVPRMAEITGRTEANVTYGVMESVENMTSLHYMAGVAVGEQAPIPEGMETWILEAKSYAVFESDLATLGQAFDEIFGSWLPQSDFQQAEGPLLERYGEDFDPQTHPVLRIYVPIKPKA